MYTKEQLEKYDFFKNLNYDIVLDSLTGTVSRPYILKFIQDLISKQIPFSIGITDIDNFKLVNDSYGHQTGDLVLSVIADFLIKGVSDNGLVGRFGGDEFLIVSFVSTSYDETWLFYKQIYNGYIRKKIETNEATLYFTATTGIARYGEDGYLFKELFMKADKALYRGKQKGRNCFIIYLDSKHKDIDLTKNRQSILTVIQSVHKCMTTINPLEKRIEKTFQYVSDLYSFSGGYYFDNSLVSSYSRDKKIIEKLDKQMIDELLEDDTIVSYNDYSLLKEKHPLIHEYCWNNGIKSFVLTKVTYGTDDFGYVLFVDFGLKRIWQQDEKAIFTYIANIIGIVKHF